MTPPVLSSVREPMASSPPAAIARISFRYASV
jgi:hypothetical protein